MTTKYRIVPKRDFPRSYGTHGFYDRGCWINHGFVVTDGFCNIMPGATWFETVKQAMHSLEVYVSVNGDAKKFWAILRGNDIHDDRRS